MSSDYSEEDKTAIITCGLKALRGGEVLAEIALDSINCPVIFKNYIAAEFTAGKGIKVLAVVKLFCVYPYGRQAVILARI